MILLSKTKVKSYEYETLYEYTPRTAIQEASRCLLCHDAPCSKACPAGTDPYKFIKSVRFKNFKGAAETIRENNVLGGICAMICPHKSLCEEACSRCGIDTPIQIGKIQRFAVEQEKLFNMKILNNPGTNKHIKVACIGSGPASLACAAKLAENGFSVTIYEAFSKPGGVITYGISSNRLPKGIADYDIDLIRQLGVKFIFNSKLGKDITIEDLKKQGYHAIFLGIGLWSAVMPKIEGNNLNGVTSAIRFLKQVKDSGENMDLGNNVIIIGCGNVALDCAITAKSLGSKNVSIYYRRTLEESPAEMDEILYAVSLGITITVNFAPSKLIGDSRVEFIQFNGRDGESKAKVKADTVIFATGQKPENIKQIADIKCDEKGLLIVDEEHKTSKEGIFAGGDIAKNGNTVVEAVAAGSSAANSIMKYLKTKLEVK